MNLDLDSMNVTQGINKLQFRIYQYDFRMLTD
jgi:hypothetical protein